MHNPGVGSQQGQAVRTAVCVNAFPPEIRRQPIFTHGVHFDHERGVIFGSLYLSYSTVTTGVSDTIVTTSMHGLCT
jgi:hypothetical protein